MAKTSLTNPPSSPWLAERTQRRGQDRFLSSNGAANRVTCRLSRAAPSRRLRERRP
jgi:hypothetical protein